MKITEIAHEDMVKAVKYCKLIAASYHHFTGLEIVPDYKSLSDLELAQRIFDADFALVSHNQNKIFCFANNSALNLWETNWSNFTKMASTKSAPDDDATQNERNNLLNEAFKKGYVDNYQGVRKSTKGNLFEIKNTTLFNVLDEDKNIIGQAALIQEVLHIDKKIDAPSEQQHAATQPKKSR